MSNSSAIAIRFVFFAAAMVAVSSAISQAPQGQAANPAPATKQAKASSIPFRNQPPRVSNREAAYLESVWGIEAPSVKIVESGIMIRFNYRVLDPVKAKVLEDKKFEPHLECPEKGVQLVVPTMEKVGQLRQAPHNIEAGKFYWMAFSNGGQIIKQGDRVDVVIGSFRVQGLQVE